MTVRTRLHGFLLAQTNQYLSTSMINNFSMDGEVVNFSWRRRMEKLSINLTGEVGWRRRMEKLSITLTGEVVN